MLHSRTEYAPVTDRVAAGARVLDELDPHWADEIDLEQLRLADGCRCILRQLFDAFVQAPLELVVDDTSVRRGWMAPSDYACSQDWYAIAREYDELDTA